MTAQELIPWVTGEAYDYADQEIWPELRYHSPTMFLQRLAYKLGIRSRKAARERGHVWPRIAQTMIGTKRAQNIIDCVEAVKGIEGCLVDCGVWRGGSTILMAAAAPERQIYCCDTFNGFASEDAEAEGVMCPKALCVPLHEVKGNFAKFGVSMERVAFVIGKVQETMSLIPGPIALLRIDVDMAAPTTACLETLWPLMSVGGRVIVDDYGDQSYECKKAVDTFLAKTINAGKLNEIDTDGVWFERNLDLGIIGNGDGGSGCGILVVDNQIS